jgi:predicted naringenin-chalcone synthase
MNCRTVYLHGIATRTPEHTYYQRHLKDIMVELLGDTQEKKLLIERIYRSSAIEKRHFVVDDEFIMNELGTMTTKGRNDIFISEARKLSLDAVERLLSTLPSFHARKISHVITVSCTGFMAPGIDFHVISQLGLNANIHRFNIGFMGCYAAFPALKLARNICLADPEARVLVVTTELCSLHHQRIFEPDIIVANALFSDGASASLVSSTPSDSAGPKLAMHGFDTQFIDDTEEEMAWSIGDNGFDLRLSAYVPKLIQKNIAQIIEPIFARNHLDKEAVGIWAIHPGGRAILDEIRGTLELAADALTHSYGVLKDHGNMSSSTIMFLLERVLAQNEPGKIFAAGFGPGLTVETGYLEKLAA